MMPQWYRYVLRIYVRRIGDDEEGHYLAVIRTTDGLLVHDDWRAPYVVPEAQLSSAVQGPDFSPDAGDLIDNIRLRYYEREYLG
jgi:hypothetical protein